MKRAFMGAGVAALLGNFAVLSQPALSAEGSPTNEQLLQLIQQQQKAIDDLRAALAETQKRTKQAVAATETATSEKSGGSFLDTITIGGVLEVEATSTSSFANADSSDLTLAKAELFVDAKPVKYVSTHVQLLFEDGNNNITLDEAFVTLGELQEFPAYVQAGQFVVPFGNFDTAMSTDPLTKNVGETKEASVLLGAEKNGFSVQGYFYNGDSQRAGNGNHIDQGGVFGGYAGATGNATYDFGIGYISNVADSDGLTTGAGATATALDSYIGGFSAHGALGFGPVALRGVYLTALDDFTAAEIAFNGQGARPGAWHLEGTYTVNLMGKETVFAATVQGTDEALALGLPEYRYGGAITVGVIEHVAVTAEYLHDEDYEVSNGGTGNNGHTATMKLAVDF